MELQTLRPVHSLADLQKAFGDVWYGNAPPTLLKCGTKAYDWMVQQCESLHPSLYPIGEIERNGVFTFLCRSVVSKCSDIPEFDIHLLNEKHLDNPKLNGKVSVEKC